MSNEISNRGVTIETPAKPKKCGLDEALEDIRAGRVYGPFNSVDEMMDSILK